MGRGFYGVPLTTCAKVMLNATREDLRAETSLREVLTSVTDRREFDAFKAAVVGL